MRLLAFLLLSLPAAVSAADGEHCFIPKVEQGVATITKVDYIEKPFCGVVLLNNRYVRLSEIAQWNWALAIIRDDRTTIRVSAFQTINGVPRERLTFGN